MKLWRVKYKDPSMDRTVSYCVTGDTAEDAVNTVIREDANIGDWDTHERKNYTYYECVGGWTRSR